MNNSAERIEIMSDGVEIIKTCNKSADESLK